MITRIYSTYEDEELLPEVDEQGNVVGSISRKHCHDGSKTLHPVVHLHLVDTEGRIFLQLRPSWKKIQPNRWDTAVGGHISFGESTEDALRRETEEETGLVKLKATKIGQYVFESEVEKELVYVFLYRGSVQAPKLSEEVADGRYWTHEEITQAMGQGILTPNFEQEYLKIVIPALKMR